LIAAPATANRLYTRAIVAVFLACTGCGSEVAVEKTAPTDTNPIVVYSTIAERIVNPVLNAYTAESGAEVLLVVGEFRDLQEKERRRGREPVADLFIADNLFDLWQAAEQNVFRPTRSDVIARRVPAQLRDPEHRWVSFASRARTIVHNPELTAAGERESIVDYASLADGVWHERLCLSSSTVAENGSLIAMLINDSGARNAELVVRGWRANLAAPVFIDDTQLLQAIAAGQCAVGIADSSEIARLLRTSSDTNIVPHRFPDGGVLHLNASGGGVTRHAQNPKSAVALLEWLTSDAANTLFATLTLGFPVNPEATTDAALAPWAGFEPNPVNIASLGYLQEDAIKLAERARYP
jgi:iron(III) transport system substrate-binding protein